MSVLSNLATKIGDSAPVGLVKGVGRVGFTIAKTGVKASHYLVKKTAINGVAPSMRFGGRLAKNAASNMISGHWNESGLANIFGPLPGWEKKNGKMVRSKPKGADSETIQALKDSSAITNEHLVSIRDAVVKMDDNMKKGFVGLYQLISGMQRQTKDPFSDIRNRRALSPSNKVAALPKPDSKGGIGGLAGLMRNALSGLANIAKGLLSTVGLLTKGVGKLVSMALALAGPVVRGLARAVAAAGSALGRGARRSIRRLTGRPTENAPRAPVGEPEAARGRPNPEARGTPEGRPTEEPHARPNGEPEANRPRPDGTPEEPHRAPTGEPEPNRPTGTPTEEPHARPNGTPEEPHARPTTEPRASTPEAPKPASTPSGAPSEAAAESAVKEGVKDAAREAGKLTAKTSLKGILSKIGGPAVVAAFEAANGFSEWSEAYDKWKKGEMTESDFKKTQRKIIAGAVAGTAGALGGAAVGAGIGTAIGGPLGTVAGAALGLGFGYYGSKFTHEASDKVMDALDKTVFRDDGTVEEPTSPQGQPQATPTTPQARPQEQLRPNPSQVRPAERMIHGSEQQSRTNNAPTVIAPTTNNNVTNNNGGGGSSGGQSPTAPGPSRPTFDPLDAEVSGTGWPMMP